MAHITCIDVSCWQENIDYVKVKASGITAVIIRAGYGREVSQKDSQFETHYKKAKSAGLKIGAYWYSYADSVADAKREAAACLACIKGKTFDMPIYYDLEDSSQVKLGKSTLTEMAKAFCEAIKAGGYRAGIYANLNWFNNYLDYADLKKSYSIWFAQYNNINQLNCDIWQNSSTGKINGINGNVDTNIIFNNNVFNSSVSTTPTKPTNTTTSKDKSIPDVIYKVKANGRWLPEVKNQNDYAGIVGQNITDVAIKVSNGSIKYRVHIKGGSWLPYVTGYNTNDDINGYAGNGEIIDAIEIYYDTPTSLKNSLGYYLKAKYRVSPLRSNYYSYQYDNEKDGNQDGYAGSFGKGIDRLQIILSK